MQSRVPLLQRQFCFGWQQLRTGTFDAAIHLVLGADVASQIDHPDHDVDLVLHCGVHDGGVPGHVIADVGQRSGVAAGFGS